ncbi:acyl carrier protein [Nonomuraea sp. 3N208]|uniref:acyl carrier protein n=1 Tax=Nonomuraea sp. 3N208 TaxID=3457421 RepID=UPI003FD13FDB
MTQEELSTWLTGRVALMVRKPADEIALDVPLGDYGVDSVSALSIVAEIEDHLGLTLDPTVLWDHPTLGELGAVLLERLSTQSA